MILSFKQWVAQARGGKVDWDELEATLVQSDLGLELTDEILDGLRGRVVSAESVQQAVIAELRRLWQSAPRDLDAAAARGTAENPFVVLIVGVNGSGKTTTCGKLAHRWMAGGRRVFLVGADTFRAAALEQIARWSERLGCGLFCGKDGGEPAAAVHAGLEAARQDGAEIVLVDTAGRLHNNSNLLRELEKIKRVAAKSGPWIPQEILMVVDGTNGSNALRQTEEFHRALGLTGVIVTKLDSSSKGGAIAAIKRNHQLDTLYIGHGEGADDLQVFNPDQYLSDFF